MIEERSPKHDHKQDPQSLHHDKLSCSFINNEGRHTSLPPVDTSLYKSSTSMGKLKIVEQSFPEEKPIPLLALENLIESQLYEYI